MNDTEKAQPLYSLETLRKKIDSIDDRVHDLLMERADLIPHVIAYKEQNNIPILQIPRETQLIRRLLGRHRGPFPKSLIIRLWREIIAATLTIESKMRAVVFAQERFESLWDDARTYFGGGIPMEKVSSIPHILAALRDGKTEFAVLPWPESEAADPWWTFLGTPSAHNIQIIGALPIHESNPNQKRGLILSSYPFGPSGEDREFLILSVNTNTSRAKILEHAKSSSILVVSLWTRTSSNASLHMLEVEGFLTPPKVEDFLARFDDPEAHIKRAGGYPLPFAVE